MGLEIALQAGSSSPREVVDLEKTPIRISDEAVAMGFQTVKSMAYQSYLPEYPKTDNAGFGYCINVGHLSPDDIRLLGRWAPLLSMKAYQNIPLRLCFFAQE
jgi:hypothetical protein